LAVTDDPKVGTLLVTKYGGFQTGERSDVIGVLASRPVWAGALLDAIAAGGIARGDLGAFHARQIRSFNDEALSKRLAEVWGEIRSTDEGKRALIAKLKTQLTPDAVKHGSSSAGRALFAQTCAVCHRLYGEGAEFGPDLTGSGRHDLSYLLENIADPGAIVPADFRLNIVTLKDGRVLSGALGAKTERTVAVRSAGGSETIERAEIAKLEELPQSPMPEGLLLAFNETQVRDLIAYLMSDSQVPLPGAK
jgi:putative heme-binding domain-containing protein